MLITSQKGQEPQNQKGYVYDDVKGVKAIKLRIATNKAMDIWGTRILPVINGKSELGQKLIREAHEKTMHTLGVYHQGPEATMSALQSGEKGVFIPQARSHVGDYILTCGRCRETRKWTYTVDQKDKYTKNTINAAPFKEVSIDMLGPMEAKTYPGSRNT